MHRLQQHILQQLITNPELRYARLKPDEVEGNLFMYHLKQLQRQGWVEKAPSGQYQLTSNGQVYADTLSLKTLVPRQQPRIVTLLAAQNQGGQWLLYRRLRQPLINTIGFPYGKLHVGETVAQAATRELTEKTGLSASLTHRGDGYITIYQNGQPVSQILFHLFYGTHSRGQLISSKVGKPFWSDLSDLPPRDLIPSLPDLIQLLNQNPHQRFFTELSYSLP